MTLHHGMFHFIAVRDRNLMLRLNRWPAPAWVRYWMIWATRGGDGWLWYAMGLIVLLFGGNDRYVALAAAGCAAAVGIAVFLSLKKLAARTRPCGLEPHCWARLLPPDRFSFPSGHTITAFAVAIPLGLFYPSLMIGLLFCACSIALSRVLLGLHFLTDVLAGCAIGVGLGYASYAVWSAV